MAGIDEQAVTGHVASVVRGQEVEPELSVLERTTKADTVELLDLHTS